MTYRSHMNPQKRKTRGKTEGSKGPLRSRGEEKQAFTIREGRKRVRKGGTEIFKETSSILLPTGPILHLQVG